MNDETSKPRWWTRLRHQPGWLAVLAVCLLLAAVLVPFGWRHYRARQLADEVRKAGGIVSFDPYGPEWIRSNLGDSWQIYFMVPARIHVGTGTFDDRYLRDLVLPLNEIHELTGLYVVDSKISRSSFGELARLKKLDRLAISGDNVDDELLRQVGRLPNLRYLYLDNSNVTDEGLRHLSGLKNLESLSLSNTDVTDEGVSELQRHLPGLDVSDD